MVFITNHALTGLLIGLGVDDPVLAAPLAFGSHFVLDAIPHFGNLPGHDFNSPLMKKLVGLDSLGVLTVTVVALKLWPDRWPVILAGIFFAVLPDVFWLPKFYWNWQRWKGFFRFHKGIQRSETPRGTIVELLWMATMIALLWKLFL